MAEVRELDTLGAWLLEKMARRVASADHRAVTVGVAENYAGLIEEVREVNRRTPAPARRAIPSSRSLATLAAARSVRAKT